MSRGEERPGQTRARSVTNGIIAFSPRQLARPLFSGSGKSHLQTKRHRGSIPRPDRKAAEERAFPCPLNVCPRKISLLHEEDSSSMGRSKRMELIYPMAQGGQGGG